MDNTNYLLQNVGRAIAATHAYNVTPSDVTDLPVSGYIFPTLKAGTVTVTPINGDNLTLTLEVNELIPIAVRRVWSTGTDADLGIVVIY
jgi:hypothetical protein